MAKLSPFPTGQELDNNGDPLALGTVEFYEAGTSTAKDAYTTQAGDVALANPATLSASGRIEVWLGDGAYKIILKDSSGNTIDERDNLIGDSSAAFLGSVYSATSNTTVNSAYQNSLISCSGTFTLSLLAAADAGEGFSFSVENAGTGVITIDPDGAETPITTLNQNEWCIYVCDGTNWKVLDTTKIKDNLAATVAPVVGDDSDDGYSVGSLWIDVVGDEAYRCLDATAGAAVWVNSTLSIDDLGAAATKGFIDDDTMGTASDSTVSSSESVKAYVDNSLKEDSATVTSAAELELSLGTEDFYEIDLKAKGVTDGADVYMQVTTDGGSTYESGASDYSWTLQNYASGQAGSEDVADTQMELTRIGVGNATGELVQIKMWVSDPSDSAEHTYFKWVASYKIATGALSTLHGSGTYNATTAIDGVRFYFSSGNIASGKAVSSGKSV